MLSELLPRAAPITSPDRAATATSLGSSSLRMDMETGTAPPNDTSLVCSARNSVRCPSPRLCAGMQPRAQGRAHAGLPVRSLGRQHGNPASRPPLGRRGKEVLPAVPRDTRD
jgi:hypothetical protein